MTASTIRTRHAQHGPPLAGPAIIVTALTIAAGILFAGGPHPDSTASDVLSYVSDHDTRLRLVGFLVFGASIPLAVFAATAYRRLRRLGVTAPGSAIAFAGGILAAGALVVSGLSLWTTAQTAHDLDAGTARALTQFAFATGGPGFAVSLALLVAGIAVPCLLLRLTSRPVAGAGLALAAVGMISSLGLLTSALFPVLPVIRFGGLAWLVVVGFTLPRDRREARRD